MPEPCCWLGTILLHPLGQRPAPFLGAVSTPAQWAGAAPASVPLGCIRQDLLCGWSRLSSPGPGGLGQRGGLSHRGPCCPARPSAPALCGRPWGQNGTAPP